MPSFSISLSDSSFKAVQCEADLEYGSALSIQHITEWLSVEDEVAWRGDISIQFTVTRYDAYCNKKSSHNGFYVSESF